MKVLFNDLRLLHKKLEKEFSVAIKRVLEGGVFIGGEILTSFEKAFALYCGASFCAGVGNGLDALRLLLMAYDVGPGDEVILPAHTFIATALAVSLTGAHPVFADIKKDDYTIDPELLPPLLTSKTRAIIPVQLYGQCADMSALRTFAQAHHLILIEDAAQAHGATQNGIPAGNLANASAFSFYPGKNLGALGDGGAITTSDAKIYEKIRCLRNYGSTEKYRHDRMGVNSRLDTLQAALLAVKLTHLNEVLKERQKQAERYLSILKERALPGLTAPRVAEGNRHTWHIFPLLCEKRDELRHFLFENGIETNLHYPLPVPMQGAYASLGYGAKAFPVSAYICSHELSLPIYPGLTIKKQDYVISKIFEFYKK